MTAHRWIMGGGRSMAGGPSDGSCRFGGGGCWPIIIFNLIFRAGNLGIVGFSCVLGILRVFQGFYKRKGIIGVILAREKKGFFVFLSRGMERAEGRGCCS